jgi:hypothetical protein
MQTLGASNDYGITGITGITGNVSHNFQKYSGANISLQQYP